MLIFIQHSWNGFKPDWESEFQCGPFSHGTNMHKHAMRCMIKHSSGTVSCAQREGRLYFRSLHQLPYTTCRTGSVWQRGKYTTSKIEWTRKKGEHLPIHKNNSPSYLLLFMFGLHGLPLLQETGLWRRPLFAKARLAIANTYEIWDRCGTYNTYRYIHILIHISHTHPNFIRITSVVKHVCSWCVRIFITRMEQGTV